MTGQNTNNLSDAIRNLIVCDTQFGWTGETTLKLPDLLDLQARGWLIEGDDNCEFSLTDEGQAVVARALQQDAPAELAEQQGVGNLPRPLEDLRDATQHVIDCADGGDDYACGRPMIEAMTTLGIMEKTGRGLWSTNVQVARAVVDALAATGKQQVGEVQGDALTALRRYRMAFNTVTDEMGLYEDDTGSYVKLQDVERALAARQPGAQEPVEMSPDFTDSARGAIAWVLWHHQGGSSPIGQPLRHALGMGSDQRLSQSQIEEAKRFALWAGATTNDFHRHKPAQGIDLGLIVRECCEAEVADPDHEATICISVSDLTAIIAQHSQRDAAPGVGNG